MRKICLLLLVIMMICACSCEKPGAYADNQPESSEVKQRPKSEASETVLASSKHNVIYSYTLQDVVYPDQYTAIVISFLKNDKAGNVFESSFPHLPETVAKFKEEHPYTKVLAGLGGASNSDIMGVAVMNEAARKNLAETTAALIKAKNLDGVDLDWEYYSDYSECNAAYLDLAIQLRALLGDDYIISMAGQSASSFYNEASCIKMMNEVLDYTNVMTYDFDYNARKGCYIGYNGNFTSLKNVMNGYANVVDKSKLVVGLPFYGLKYTMEESKLYYRGDDAVRYEGDLSYSKILGEIGELAANPQAYDDDNGVALAYKRKNMYVFDNATTVTAKTKWACENGYGGMMAWVANADDAIGTLGKSVTIVLNEY